MRIQSSPDLLVIENRPLMVALMLAAMLLLFVGIGLSTLAAGEIGTGLAMTLGAPLFLLPFFIIFVRRNQLILDRREGALIHRRKSLTGYTERRHDLAALTGAEVESSRSSDTRTYRMVYVLDGGESPGRHPFTSSYSSGSGAQRAAQAVNDWLSAAPGG